VTVTRFLSTKPAEALIAAGACHFIAAINLFNSCFAFRAVLYITISSCPCIEFGINICITFTIVPNLPTFEAHLEATLALRLIAFCSLSDESVAIRLSAPLKIWV